MMTVRNFGEGTIYVTFPKHPNFVLRAIIPADVEAWMKEYSISPNFGFIQGVKSGMFLEGQDAVAFRLRFGL